MGLTSEKNGVNEIVKLLAELEYPQLVGINRGYRMLSLYTFKQLYLQAHDLPLHNTDTVVHEKTYGYNLELLTFYAYDNTTTDAIIYIDEDFDLPARILLGVSAGLSRGAADAARQRIAPLFTKIDLDDKARGIYRCIKQKSTPRAVDKLLYHRLILLLDFQPDPDILKLWDNEVIQNLARHLEVDKKFREVCEEQLEGMKHLITMARHGGSAEGEYMDRVVLGLIIGVYETKRYVKRVIESSLPAITQELCDKGGYHTAVCGSKDVDGGRLFVSLICSNIPVSGVRGRGSAVWTIFRNYISVVYDILKENSYNPHILPYGRKDP
jgi:hypothetical protein